MRCCRIHIVQKIFDLVDFDFGCSGDDEGSDDGDTHGDSDDSAVDQNRFDC